MCIRDSTYTDLLEFAGPVQGLIRDYFGWTQAGEYWFPEIRSLGGAIFVMSFVLYPYIYLMTKTALRLTSPSYIELARLSKPLSAVWVDLYLARPAIIAGLALVLMEVLSDFGTVEYFTVETITLGIFNIWLGMNNLTAAAQIAGLAFIFIIFLLALEQRARSRQKFFDATKSYKSLNPRSLPLSLGLACTIFCLIPIIVGFAIPVTILATFVFRGLAITNFDLLISASLNSIMIALAKAIIIEFSEADIRRSKFVIAKPLKTKVASIVTGIAKPTMIGIKQNIVHANPRDNGKLRGLRDL